ncbi:MAG: hypothetical protein WCP82_06640 [Alphaproteobacteria bacterium]
MPETFAPSAPAATFLPRPLVWLLAGLLLAGYGGMCLKIAHDTSPTFDEPDHLAVGYYALVTGYRPYTNINLTFTQMWSALPLLLAKTAPEIELPPDPTAPVPPRLLSKPGSNPEAPKYRPVSLPARMIRALLPFTLFAKAPHFPNATEELAGRATGINYGRLFYFDSRNDTERIVFWSRAMITMLAVALGAVLFLWARRLWGDLAGLVTLVFYCLNPQTIALGSFATTDIASTLFFTLAMAAVWRLLHRVSLLNILLTGLAAGVLGATKISSLLIIPVTGLLLIVRLFDGRPVEYKLPGQAPMRVSHGRWARFRMLLLALAGAVAVAYATLWAFYAFRYTATDQDVPEANWAENAMVQANLAPALIKFSRVHHLLPEAYLFDLHQFTTTGSIRRAFLMGEYSVDGWWYFFPVAWLFKTPLPFMLALGVSVVLLWRARREQAAALWSLAPLLGFSLVYGLSAVAGNLNIGARHLLPIYPLLFLLAGFATRLRLGPKWRPVWIAGICLWSAAEAATVHPHYLAYFNELAGGSVHGHRILVDSSYEWGEGLPDVKRWLAAREAKATEGRPNLPVYISYFGVADLPHYGIRPIGESSDKGNVVMLPSFYDQRPIRPYDLGAGTYIISATMLKSLYGAKTMGPWRPSYEERFQALVPEMARLRLLLTTTDQAARSDLLEKDGRNFVKQMALQQLAAADDPAKLPRERAIAFAKTILEQQKKTAAFIKQYPDPVALDNALDRAGRDAVKQQAQQQIAMAGTTTLSREQAIQSAMETAAQEGKTDEVARLYPDAATRNKFYEQKGQELLAQLKQQFIQRANQTWLEQVAEYDQLRFSRLCAYLRTREPETRIGYGILVFELSAEELNEAISPTSPPKELRKGYLVKGTETRTEPGQIDFIR